MMSWLRAWPGRLLALVLAIGMGSASLEQLRHAGEDDAACAIRVVAHDAADHAFTAAVPGDAADHCFICHWARSLRLSPAAATRTVAMSAVAAVRLVPFDVLPASAPQLSRLPARAPPLA